MSNDTQTCSACHGTRYAPSRCPESGETVREVCEDCLYGPVEAEADEPVVLRYPGVRHEAREEDGDYD